jgi:hypothetical protein
MGLFLARPLRRQKSRSIFEEDVTMSRELSERQISH